MAAERREPAVPLPGNIGPTGAPGGRPGSGSGERAPADPPLGTDARAGLRPDAREEAAGRTDARPGMARDGATSRAAAGGGDARGGIGRAPWVAILAGLAVGILLGVFGVLVVQKAGDSGDPFDGALKSGRFQAVILANDKVYFGQSSDKSDEFYLLRNAFFLRETTPAAGGEPQRSLLPVNRELQAPENTMLIRKDQVVLVENLAADSPIQKEIERQLGPSKKG